MLVGAALFAAGLTSAYLGMRDVMRTSGGFCASGGPYVIAHQCAAGDVRQLTIGILVMLLGGAIYVGTSAWMDGPVLAPGLLLWAALFGSLGWNFIDLRNGTHGSPSGGSGYLVSGIVFWLMAAGGVIPVLVMAAGWLRRGGESPAPPAAQFPTGPIVRAATHPTAPAPSPPSTEPLPPTVPRRLVIPPRDTP